MTQATLPDTSSLADALQGAFVGRDHPEYDELRRGFNAMIDRHPLAIVQVETEADVALAIGFARSHDLPLAIRAGGHSAPGHYGCDDGIVVDCRALRRIDVDPIGRTARCDTGVTWKDLDAATGAHGLALTGGRVSGTGVAGLTIGSGSGWLERAMGLTSDSLTGARVVTAEGVVVDTDDDPDLLWALRGGGGNFGVITELRFALQPLGPVVHGGKRLYPAERGAELLIAFGEVMMAAPKELCGGLAFITAPPAPWVPEEVRGTIVVATITLWAGDPADAEREMAALDVLGTPLYDGVGPIAYSEIQQIMDPGAPPGHRDYFKGGFMGDLTAQAAADIAAIGVDMRAPLTQVICAPLGSHTAYAAVGEEHSAIGHRQEQWSFQVLSLWDSAEDDAEQRAWTRDAAATMSRHSDMVSYPNFLSADEAGDVADAYSPAVMARLTAVKDRYDPTNLFRINNNIVPS